MYQGETLENVITKTESDSGSRHDLLVPSSQLRFFGGRDVDNQRVFKLKIVGDGPELNNYYPTSQHVESQICSKLHIGSKYWNHMRTKFDDLLQMNVNVGLNASNATHILRTLNGDARAFLSDRYDCLDNYDVLTNTFKTLQDMGMVAGSDYRIDSCTVYKHKLYLKILFPKITGVVKVGDVVEAGILVGNCEVGVGSTYVRGFVNRLVCTNGMVSPLMGKHPMVKRHTGPRLSVGDYNLGAPYRTIFSDATMRAEAQLTLSKMKDVISFHANPDNFQMIVDMMTSASRDNIVGDPAAVVTEIGHTYSLTSTERDIVLSRLINHDAYRDGMSRWGIVNAITEASKQASNYARATDLEAKGGLLLAMKPSVWKKYSESTLTTTDQANSMLVH